VDGLEIEKAMKKESSGNGKNRGERGAEMVAQKRGKKCGKNVGSLTIHQRDWG